MVRILICSFFCSLLGVANAQETTELDSLRAVIENSESSFAKINALNHLGIKLGNSKDASLPLYKQALKLAIKNEEDSLTALTYGNIATVYYYSGQHDSALHSMLQVVSVHEKWVKKISSHVTWEILAFSTENYTTSQNPWSAFRGN